jgi:hypothetical protein
MKALLPRYDNEDAASSEFYGLPLKSSPYKVARRCSDRPFVGEPNSFTGDGLDTSSAVDALYEWYEGVSTCRMCQPKFYGKVVIIHTLDFLFIFLGSRIRKCTQLKTEPRIRFNCEQISS